MAGMFCSLEEAAQRLGKTEQELTEMIEQGTLREFRDGPNLLLKVDEIEELARREGIELSAESLQEEATPPPPLATIPTTLETEPEELEMEKPETPELDPLETPASDDADLDASELQSLDDMPDLDLPDLDLPDLAAVSADDAIPAPDAGEPMAALEVPFTEEETPAKKGKGKKAKAKAKRKPKAKKQPKPRPIKVHASNIPSRSFGQWLMGGLRNDSLVAIIVLLMIMGFVVAAIVALGCGAYYAANNFL